MNFKFSFSRTESASSVEYWVKIETAQVNSLVLDWRGLVDTDPLDSFITTVGLERGESADYLIDLSFEQFCLLEIHQLIFQSLLDDNWELE